MGKSDSDKIFEKIISDSPALTKMMYDLQYARAKPMMKFPGGLRYRYWGRFELFTGIWAFCYSTTRNENGKFVSWVYMPIVGRKSWTMKKVLEHRLMKDAKTRALRMYHQHQAVQDKYEALLKKRQRKGRKQ